MEVENSGVAMNEGDLDAAIDSALDAVGDDELVDGRSTDETPEEGTPEESGTPTEAPTEEPPAAVASTEETPAESPPEPEPEDEDPANVLLKQLAELEPQVAPAQLPEGVEADTPAARSFQAQRTLLSQALDRERGQKQQYNETIGKYNQAVEQLRQANHQMEVEMAQLKARIEYGTQPQQPQPPQQPQVDEYGRPVPQTPDFEALLEKKFEEKMGPIMQENQRLQEAAAAAQRAQELEADKQKWQQYTSEVCNKTIFNWQDHPVSDEVRAETEKIVYSLAYHLEIPIEQAARQADKLFTSYVAEKMRAASKAGKARAKALKKIPDAGPPKGIVAKGGSGYKKTGTGDLGDNLDRAFNRSAPPPPDEEGIVDLPL